jgi:hypothetical protein
MDHHQVSFLSDCAHLVDLLNSYDHSNLPDWRMKPHIQIFQDYTRDRRAQVHKIDRNLNSTTDTLARLAFFSPVVQYQNYVPSCSYEHNDHQCPLLAALSSIPLVHTRILVVACC